MAAVVLKIWDGTQFYAPIWQLRKEIGQFLFSPTFGYILFNQSPRLKCLFALNSSKHCLSAFLKIVGKLLPDCRSQQHRRRTSTLVMKTIIRRLVGEYYIY